MSQMFLREVMARMCSVRIASYVFNKFYLSVVILFCCGESVAQMPLCY